MNREESNISRREALRRLLQGSAWVVGAAVGLTALTGCRRRRSTSGAEATMQQPKIACIGCGLCMPCPYGIDIPGNIQAYNDAISLNELPDPRQSAHPDYPALRRKFLQQYDGQLDHFKRADHCIGCGRCVSSCPQKLDIPQLMSQISALTEGLRRTK